MVKRKPLKESPSPSASTREASSTRYDTQFNPVDTTKNIVKGLGQALFNAGTGRNGGVVGVGKGAVQSFAGTASRVDDYAVRALNATGIKKATPVALQSAKRNTYGYETADLLNVLAVKAGAGKTAGKVVQKAANVVAETGVPGQILNTLTNKTVVVHGSPTPNIKVLQPKSGAAIGNTTPHVFVREVTRRNMFDDSLAAGASHYANEGSVYISKVNKKDLTSVEKLYGGNYPNYKVINKPVPVYSEIKIPSGLNNTQRNTYVSEQIVSTSKRAGVGSLDIHPTDNLRASKRFVTELTQKNVADLQRKIRWAKYDRIINKAKKK